MVPLLPTDRYEAARLTYIESLSEGNQRVGRRPLMSRWGLEQREAEEIITEVEKERSNDRNLWICRGGCTFPDHPMMVSR
ncbi:hypothetical protein ACFQX6_43785 [Streptosporangium lutulentum]